MEQKLKPLGFKEYFVYGLGNFASQLSWTMVGTYLSVFYTDVFGLTPIYGYANARIEVYPDRFCTVSHAQRAAAHAAENSCGRCTFCREGNYQLARFDEKQGEESDQIFPPGEPEYTGKSSGP